MMCTKHARNQRQRVGLSRGLDFDLKIQVLSQNEFPELEEIILSPSHVSNMSVEL